MRRAVSLPRPAAAAGGPARPRGIVPWRHGRGNRHRAVAKACEHAAMNARDAAEILVDDLLPQRRSLRLAVVTETYPPEVNGVAATIAPVVEGLVGRGHQVQLIRPRQNGADRADAHDHRLHEVLLRGLPIPRYPQLRMGLPARRALVERWSRQRPDVVHLVTEGPLGWSALQAALQLRLPVVSEFRTNFHAYSRHYGVAWLRRPIVAYLRRFHNRTACTMVPTETLRRELDGCGFERLAVVARGVDTVRFDPARRCAALRQSWGCAADDRVLVYVGRLAPEKNLDLLLRCHARMLALDARLRLVFVGDGPERAALQARCPGAVFAGARSGDDLAAHYASGDLFLFPSLTETYGNVTAEALASGLAVLAYDHAAAAQLIRDGDNGLLAPLGDEAAFVERALQLALRPELAQALRPRARLAMLGHDWPRIVAQVEAVMAAAARPEPAVAARAERGGRVERPAAAVSPASPGPH
jgi:glycosyltransferase involved in cell wall biosynthesis